MRLLSRIQAGGESGEPIGLYHRWLADHALRGPRVRSAAQSPVPLVFLMKLALLPGDGIGPEIVAQARKVLQRLGLKLEMREAAVGGAGYDAAEDPLPPATLSLAKEADAILFGAVGGPRYDGLPRAKRPEQALLRLRKELGLFANLRPAQVHPQLAAASALKGI